MDLLDPKTDLVFKLLLTRRPTILRSMIETVLDLNQPILSCEILETAFTGNDLDAVAGPEKMIILDVRVRLPNGSQIDLEMQARKHTNFDARLLYYWAKVYSGTLRSGKDYDRLRPVIVIAWLNAAIFETPHYHNIFEVRERQSHARLSEHLAIHILELPKARGLAASDETPSLTERRLRLWTRSFLSQDPTELEALAQEDPIMREAKEALEELSADQQTRLAVQAREMSLVAYYDSLAAEREAGEALGLLKGKAEGEAKGKAEGKAEGKAAALLKLIEKRFGSVTSETATRVQRGSADQLDVWFDRIFDAKSVNELLADS